MKTLEKLKIGGTSLLNLLFPIGSIHFSVSPTNPSNYFGGTWVAWGSGRVPVGVNTNDESFNSVEKTGGEKTHALKFDELPLASFTAYGSSGDWTYVGLNPEKPHNNLQPYITCYMWKRTK